MLGRIQSCEVSNAPIPQSALAHSQVDSSAKLRDELKLALEYIFELSEKLSKLSWTARNIAESWLREGKTY